jgi:hypothetical protein
MATLRFAYVAISFLPDVRDDDHDRTANLA